MRSAWNAEPGFWESSQMLVRRVIDSATSPRAFVADRRGAAAIVMALLTPILIAGLAFGAEVGFWELQRRKLQNAVDTAAYAAATQLRSGVKDETTLKTFALDVAIEGGYKAGPAGIGLSNPPASGGYAGNADAIRVTLDHTIKRGFTGIFKADPIQFTVESTVLVRNGRPACVLSLNPTAASAIKVGGSTSVSLTGCDIAANSISSSSITQGGSSTLSADCISTVGESNMSSITLSDCPAPIEHAPVTADPYRDVPEPDASMGCASVNDKKEFTTQPNNVGNPLPTSESPTNNNLGLAYCLSGNNIIQGETNLAPGVYVIKGPGEVKVNAGAILRGDDVTLFLTDGATLDIAGGAVIDLSAPKTGPYAGIVVFFDRDFTGASTINGGANFSLVGAVYGPSQDIQFSGNTTGSGPGECTQVVGSTVEFIGNSGFNTDCSASGTRSIRTAQAIKIVE